MESTLYAATRTTLFICRLHRPIHCQSVSLQLTRPFNGESQRSKALSSISHSPNSLPTLCSVRSRLHCAASPSSTAGGGGADGGALSPDAIIINVEVRELLKETFHYRKSKGFLASATSPLMVFLAQDFAVQRSYRLAVIKKYLLTA
ncbi:hypothetical protein TEA_020875 [Camellia sinensis var. sinensis]|uniref:Uncharacterized protein n=1 Tax=Camellia sinensis var. sinensis TaxID=542762 RepID=A0A4S4DI52_CAMSN|nr:hypothetical protein TEA_020875 [Camellia sinensis var. sinensis]